ncbi:MAG: GAF domain-containing protein, partial [Myxococcales bacterium]|nr:GAF domain-containing protein [Myxococcales bacterium]
RAPSESVESLELKSVVGAPLLVQDRLIGVVYLDNRLVRGLFGPEDLRLLVAMCNHIAIALESSRLTRYMRITRDQALEASRLKSAFLTHMSHELRTPLNAVIGYSEILAEDLATRAPDALPDLTRIGDAGKHLLELISDVLDLAKLESGKLELHRARFEIGPLVEEAVDSVKGELARNDNDLQVSCPPGIGELCSDRQS